MLIRALLVFFLVAPAHADIKLGDIGILHPPASTGESYFARILEDGSVERIDVSFDSSSWWVTRPTEREIDPYPGYHQYNGVELNWWLDTDGEPIALAKVAAVPPLHVPGQPGSFFTGLIWEETLRIENARPRGGLGVISPRVTVFVHLTVAESLAARRNAQRKAKLAEQNRLLREQMTARYAGIAENDARELLKAHPSFRHQVRRLVRELGRPELEEPILDRVLSTAFEIQLSTDARRRYEKFRQLEKIFREITAEVAVAASESNSARLSHGVQEFTNALIYLIAYAGKFPSSELLVQTALGAAALVISVKLGLPADSLPLPVTSPRWLAVIIPGILLGSNASLLLARTMDGQQLWAVWPVLPLKRLIGRLDGWLRHRFGVVGRSRKILGPNARFRLMAELECERVMD